MAGGGIGVLAHDQHLDVVKGLVEGAQDVRARGQVLPAFGDLLAQELAHVGDLLGDGLERACPSGFDDFVQGTTGHGC
ncbi:hypothetical protein GCM10020001_065500 [Nonomuraea salmonea]